MNTELKREIDECLRDLRDMKRCGQHSLDSRGYSRDAMIALMEKVAGAI